MSCLLDWIVKNNKLELILFYKSYKLFVVINLMNPMVIPPWIWCRHRRCQKILSFELIVDKRGCLGWHICSFINDNNQISISDCYLFINNPRENYMIIWDGGMGGGTRREGWRDWGREGASLLFLINYIQFPLFIKPINRLKNRSPHPYLVVKTTDDPLWVIFWVYV